MVDPCCHLISIKVLIVEAETVLSRLSTILLNDRVAANAVEWFVLEQAQDSRLKQHTVLEIYQLAHAEPNHM